MVYEQSTSLLHIVFYYEKKKRRVSQCGQKSKCGKTITAKVRKKTGLMDSDLYQGRN